MPRAAIGHSFAASLLSLAILRLHPHRLVERHTGDGRPATFPGVDPYLHQNDVLAWLLACGVEGVVETHVGNGAEVLSGEVDLAELGSDVAVPSWPAYNEAG